MAHKRKERIVIDLEVYSDLNIRDTGPYKQAEHPSTDIIFVGYKIHTGPTKVWWSCKKTAVMPEDLREALEDVNRYDLVAHNAAYDRLMLVSPAGERLGFKKRWLKWNRWVCTLARCLMIGVPASLDKAAKALNLSEQKDNKGKAAMLAICKPDRKGKRVLRAHAMDKYKISAEYCGQDINTTYAVDKYIPDLTDYERFNVWCMDKRINERGLQVDMKTVNRIFEYAERYKEELTDQFREATGLNPTQNAKVLAYLQENGMDIDNVRAATLAEEFDKLEEGDLKDTLAIKMSLSKASTSKYTKIRKVVCADNRLRGMLEYHKAGTGRWAGKIVQLQNLTKETLTLQQSQIIRMVNSCTYEEYCLLYPDVYESFKRCLRGVFVAKDGYRLAVADLSQIEARVILWHARDEAGLEAFASGQDMYKREAIGVYKTLEGKDYTIDEVTSEMRAIGKVASLALGFQGGKGAFLQMAQNFGITVSEEDAEKIKVAWRNANPKIVKMWRDVEDACIKAVEGREAHYAARCKIQKVKDYLVIQLPSGRRLFYFKPEVFMSTFKYTKDGEEKSFTKEAIRYMGVKAVNGGAPMYQWITTHGGKLVENIVQGCARDKIAFDMVAFDKRKGNMNKIVLTVHDEIIIEETDKNTFDIEQYNAIMRVVPPWLKGMPLDADGFCARRYNK
jgi:DNA polymerase